MKQGFTLIEMTMVLLIIGLLIGSFIIPLGAQMDINNLKLTDQRLAQIKEALLGYAARNRRLPCPDTDNDGKEDSASCGQEGNLPWADLGIDSKDAWGSYFRYRADSTQTIAGAYNTSIPVANNALKVKNKADTITFIENAVAIVFSNGKDKVANSANAVVDQTYTQDDFVPKDFDDRLIWLSDSELVSRLAAAGFRIK
jgi:prepilin-type N-terminal cleavage/methylation domain-containing protein